MSPEALRYDEEAGIMSRSGRKGNWVPADWDDRYPRRYERAAEIRRAVLFHSHKLLTEVGPRAFTVKEAARRAGVGRTTVYKYFGLKAELLAACRADFTRRGSRRLSWSPTAMRSRVIQDSAGTLPSTLEAVRQAVLTIANHLEAEADLFLLAAAEGVRSRRRPRGHAENTQTPPPLPERFFTSVIELLKEALQSGHLPSDLDPKAVASWLGALWWYDLSIRGPYREAELYEQSPFGEHIERILRILAAALPGSGPARAAR